MPSLSGRLAFGTDNGLWVMNADGFGLFQVTHPPTNTIDYNPSWSPDGQRLAFRREPKDNGVCCNPNQGVTVVGVDGRGLRNLLEAYGTQVTAGTPSWSPNGSKIAITCHCPEGEGIYVVNPDGSGLAKLSGAHTQYPRWSPDGTRIAYLGEQNGNHEIFVMDADGNNPANLTNNTAMDAGPRWSPDGQQIVFFSDRDGNEEIYRMNADGSQPVRLTRTPGNEEFPVWAPDGRIAFDADRNGDGFNEWYLIDADGSGETQLKALSDAHTSDFVDWLR